MSCVVVHMPEFPDGKSTMLILARRLLGAWNECKDIGKQFMPSIGDYGRGCIIDIPADMSIYQHKPLLPTSCLSSPSLDIRSNPRLPQCRP